VAASARSTDHDRRQLFDLMARRLTLQVAIISVEGVAESRSGRAGARSGHPGSLSERFVYDARSGSDGEPLRSLDGIPHTKIDGLPTS
jgi:hypothetical protein